MQISQHAGAGTGEMDTVSHHGPTCRLGAFRARYPGAHCTHCTHCTALTALTVLHCTHCTALTVLTVLHALTVLTVIAVLHSHALTHSLSRHSHALTHSLSRSLAISSLTRCLTHSLTRCLVHSLSLAPVGSSPLVNALWSKQIVRFRAAISSASLLPGGAKLEDSKSH